MFLLLDTSTPVCRLILIDGEQEYSAEWEAGRSLADGLLGYIEAQLADRGKAWHDIKGFGVFEGPGSFTGLRIGMTVLNTLADALSVPIVGMRGDNWSQEAVRALEHGEDQRLVVPYYGGEANITKPRK